MTVSRPILVDYGSGLTEWLPAETKAKLKKLSKADKNLQWIQADLNLEIRSTFGNLIWKILGLFNIVRNKYFGINLKQSQNVLNQLKSEIISSYPEIKKLFNKAATRFNVIAPKHQVDLIEIIKPAPQPIHSSVPPKNTQEESVYDCMSQSIYLLSGKPRPKTPETPLASTGVPRISGRFTSPLKPPQSSGVSKSAEVVIKIGSSKLIFITGDIAAEKLGKKGSAIVNAANAQLQHGSGVDDAIHKAAGSTDLEQACAKIRDEKGPNLKDSECVHTPAFKLDAEYIIHAVGPRDSTPSHKQLLKDTYAHALELAQKLQVKKISFPAISTGVFGITPEVAAPIAMQAIKDFLIQNPGTFDEVRIVFRSDSISSLYQKALTP